METGICVMRGESIEIRFHHTPTSSISTKKGKGKNSFLRKDGMFVCVADLSEVLGHKPEQFSNKLRNDRVD